MKKLILGLTILLILLNSCANEKEKIDKYNKESIVGTWVEVDTDENDNSAFYIPSYAFDILTDFLYKDTYLEKLEFTKNNNLIHSYKYLKDSERGLNYNSIEKEVAHGEGYLKYHINANILNLRHDAKEEGFPSYYNIKISNDTLYMNLIIDSTFVAAVRIRVAMYNYPTSTNEVTDEIINSFREFSTIKFYKISE